MFNVYLPTLLEYRARGEGPVELTEEAPASLSGPLWEVVIFTIGGCPGALVGTNNSLQQHRTISQCNYSWVHGW
jgi:hypothetical protein